MAERFWSPVKSIVVCGLVCLNVTGPAHADGEFAQMDISRETTGIVLSFVRSDWTADVSFAEYPEGWTQALSLRRALPLDMPFTFKVGPTVARSYDRSTASTDVEAGLRVSAERYQPTNFGSIYLLADVSSVDATAFGLAQVGLSNGFSIEVSSGRSDTYSETTVAVSQRVGDGPFAVRAGYRFDTDVAFIGFSINTF